MVWRHMKAAKSKAQAQAPIVLDELLPPPKRRCIAHFQADAGSSSSGHPQFHAPSFDTDPPPPFYAPSADPSPPFHAPSADRPPPFHVPSFDTDLSPPFLDPPADLDLPQPPSTVPPRPRRSFDDILLGLHGRTHRNPDESNDEDSEDAPEEVAAEDPELVDPGTDDVWNEEDADTEDELDLREGVVSDWDILAEKFITEAEEFGMSVQFFIAYSVTHRRFVFRSVFHLGP